MADEIDPQRPSEAQAAAERARSWRRRLLFALGLAFTGVGAVGLVVPLLPGAPFLILAAGCFARSSPRFDAWLVAHPRFGPPVRRWRERGAIPLYAKWIAAVSMGLSYALIARSDWPLAAKAALAALFIAVLAFMFSRPSR